MAQGFLTTVIYTRAQERVNQQVATDFEEMTSDNVHELFHHLETYGDMLYATRGLFAATAVDADAWDSFVHNQSAPSRYAGMKAIAYAEIVPAGRIKSYERTLQTTQNENITIRPKKTQADHIVLTYHEEVGLPKTELFNAIGFDLTSSPERYEAIKLATTTGNMTATSNINLLTNDKAGFLLILPLSERFGNHSSKRSVFGYGIAAFDMEGLINSTIGPHLDRDNLSLTITDVTKGGASTLFEKKFTAPGQSVKRDVDIQVANRTWRMDFQAPRDSLLISSQRLAPTAILTTGIGFMVTTSILTYALRLRGRLRSSG